MNAPNILFIVIVAVVVTQRIIELRIANRNTKNLLENGGVEFGKNHYWILISLHTLFFVSLIVESLLAAVHISEFWFPILTVFLIAQAGRFWVIHTMNGRWTTRIIVLPGKKPVDRGLFQVLRHPNYVVVALEIFTLPLLFELHYTAFTFSALNAVVLLLIRIPEENRALWWAH